MMTLLEVTAEDVAGQEEATLNETRAVLDVLGAVDVALTESPEGLLTLIELDTMPVAVTIWFGTIETDIEASIDSALLFKLQNHRGIVENISLC